MRGGRRARPRGGALARLPSDLHKAPLPGLQHRAGLLLAPADVVRLVVASEVLVQLAGTHEQEGALQGLCPGGGRGGPGVRAGLSTRQPLNRGSCWRCLESECGFPCWGPLVSPQGGLTSAAVLGGLWLCPPAAIPPASA